MRILGIDLGTTNSLIAFYDDDGAHIIPNRLGENLTPSCVNINEEGEVFVGRIAKERLLAHENMTADNFKRYMGSNKNFNLADKTFLAEELSSFIIRSLVEDAKEYLKEEIAEVVISVPAYFNDVQRKATKRAGELAGLTVGRIINEPTAAAIAYGLEEQDGETKFLIIDLGGGTFDVSILEQDENIMEVRGVAGDNFLGGEDFTELLVSMFLDKSGVRAEELNAREQILLRNQAELAKKSGADTLAMRCKIAETDYDVRIEENEYEQAAKPLLTRLRRPIERALGDAAIKISEIDNIVLVGGATKLPIIKRFIGKLFKKFPLSNINPDEVVAMGAAMQAAMKERNKAIREIILTDVCPYTLGTDVCINKENGRMEAGYFFPIIERNTVIPVSRVNRFNTTHDNQKSIRIEILQGESRYTKNNIALGELNVPVPMAAAGKEAVDVRYTYDINAILEVEVEVVSTHVKKRVVIEQNPGYMTSEEVEARLSELAQIKIHPRDQEENKLLIARAERLYEENTGDIRRFIGGCLEHFEEVLEYQDKMRTKEAAAIFKQQLDSVTQEWF